MSDNKKSDYNSQKSSGLPSNDAQKSVSEDKSPDTPPPPPPSKK